MIDDENIVHAGMVQPPHANASDKSCSAGNDNHVPSSITLIFPEKILFVRKRGRCPQGKYILSHGFSLMFGIYLLYQSCAGHGNNFCPCRTPQTIGILAMAPGNGRWRAFLRIHLI
jgi:hypothetical protein